VAWAPVGYAGWGIRCASAYVGGETSMKRRPGCWACAQAITEAMPVCRTRVYSSLVIAAPEGQGNCARISEKNGRTSKENLHCNVLGPWRSKQWAGGRGGPTSDGHIKLQSSTRPQCCERRYPPYRTAAHQPMTPPRKHAKHIVSFGGVNCRE